MTMRTTTQEQTVRSSHSTDSTEKYVLTDQIAKKFCPNFEICNILRLWSQEFAIAICYAKRRWLKQLNTASSLLHKQKKCSM